MHLLLPDLSIPFVTIALAELGDKSQILIFLLSSRTKNHLRFLLGVMFGFLIVDGFAIWIGSWLVELVPDLWMKIISGSIFILIGLLMIFAKSEDEKESVPPLKNPLMSGFGLIFLAEWGDKTQIASALFGAQYNPVFVLIAVMSALFLLSASAIYLGKVISHKVNRKYTTRIGGLVFVILGLLSLSQ